jgi:PAS domain S-box-containing protein
MIRLADLSFQRKLRFAMLLTSAVALLLACAVFLGFEYIGYRDSLARTVATLARITATNSTAPIAFSDPARARETLDSLRAEPQFVAAELRGTDGKLVARYDAGADEMLTADHPPPSGVHFSGKYVVGAQPVVENERRLGTLYLWASLSDIYRRIGTYSIVVLAVLGSSIIFAWLLSSVLLRTLAEPVLELANTASAVSAGQDFSLRARQYGRDELGRLTAAFNLMLDRTQAAVVALRKSEAQLRLVTDNASVFLTQCDREYRFKFVNRPYAERFGLEPDQMIGRGVFDVLGVPAFETILPHMNRALAGERVEVELEVPYVVIGTRWMHMVYVPERSPEGEVIGFVGIITDASLRKQTEREIARARDEALAASRAKDDFLAALSHELRTPLSPVLLLASEASQDAGLPETARADFETIRKHVELEARLIDDLLDLTRITRGKLSLERKVIDIHTVLRDAVATVTPDMAEKGIELTIRTTAGRHHIAGDAVRLQQVFWNVLKNAVKFTPGGGRIDVSTDADDGHLCVRIVDSGIGMTGTEIARAFDAFTQGDHAVENGPHRFGGLGLGLAIARMIVEMHAGAIYATSEGRGRGATFVLEFPLVDHARTPPAPTPHVASAAKVAVDVAALPDKNGATVAADGGTILLVEDHEPTRSALERLLVRRRFSVAAAATASDARTLAGEQSFDLLISDVGLPDGNGYDLMLEFRQRYGMRGIAMTGYGMEQDLARSQAAGFGAHLTKPVRVQSLDAAIADVLKR